MGRIQKAICIINDNKLEAMPFVCEIAQALAACDIDLIKPQDQPFWITSQLESGLLQRSLEQDHPDVALIFGGDGSILHTARLLAAYSVPLIGVNLGNLGFLASIEKKNLAAAVSRLAAGDFNIRERMMLRCQLLRQERVVQESIALNDVVLRSREIARDIISDIFVDGEFAATYRGDGVIVSSPLGSTAYALSAGGPVVMPELELLLITPLAAHTLSARPIAVPPERKVELAASPHWKDAICVLDGHLVWSLNKGDRILISKSDKKVRIADLGYPGFFTTLRRKLQIGCEESGK